MIKMSVISNGKLYAEVFDIEMEKISTTNFFSDPKSPLQFGVLSYEKGHAVKKHKHKNIERRHSEFAEATFVLSGKEEVSIFSEEDKLLEKFELSANQLLITYNGYHSMNVLEEFKALEFKVGPYISDDKAFL